MPLSVVISSYNDGPRLHRTIAPLLADPATDELIIVIDGSDDGSFEALQARARQDGRVRPFFIENRGRAGARQFGIEQAASDVVLLIDSDVIAADNSLVGGHARWHADGRARLVVGYMPVRVPDKYPGSFVVEHYSRMYELRCAEYERNPGSILGGLWGGNISLPRQAIAAAGGFDGGLGVIYSEDLELGFRLAKTGLEPVFDRRLLAEHEYTRSVAGFLDTGRQYGEAIVKIDAKHPGRVMFPPPPPSRLDASLRSLAIRPRINRVLVGLGTQAVLLAGRLHAWRVESRIGYILERLQIEVGMRNGRTAVRSGAAPEREGGRVGDLEIARRATH